MKVMAGRFGPYVTDGTTNATLPRDQKPEDLTPEQAIALIDAKAAKGPAKGKKKAPAKKAPAKKAAPKKAAAKKGDEAAAGEKKPATKKPAAKKAPAKKAVKKEAAE